MTLIIVSGAIANKLNQGGEAWVRLSYVLGLERLGYDVYFVEQISRDACVDVHGSPSSFEASANLAYFREVMETFELTDRAFLLPTDGDTSSAVDRALLQRAESARALINVSGHLTLPALLERIPNKVFVDIDPGYTQYWHAAGLPGAHVDGHDWYFTIGENIGTQHCPIPAGNLHWQATRPPVVLDQWPLVQMNNELRFTTIANWRGSFGPVQVDGKTFGLKVHEFRKVFDLPLRCRLAFEIALNIDPADHKDLFALRDHGWIISDPAPAASTPDRFRGYVQQSGAEFSVAQGIYVETNCGWFSDRTARYLASGKPALVQETGFSSNIQSGKGLVAFRTLDEAVAGAESIAANYAAHSRAARALAERYLDSDKVLGKLMQQIGVSA